MLFSPLPFLTYYASNTRCILWVNFKGSDVISLCDYHSPGRMYLIYHVSYQSVIIRHKVRGVRRMIKFKKSCVSFFLYKSHSHGLKESKNNQYFLDSSIRNCDFLVFIVPFQPDFDIVYIQISPIFNFWFSRIYTT